MDCCDMRTRETWCRSIVQIMPFLLGSSFAQVFSLPFFLSMAFGVTWDASEAAWIVSGTALAAALGVFIGWKLGTHKALEPSRLF